jgi:CheY-like chemotaxis protein
MRDEQYLQMGVNDIISKPFSIEGLRQTVQRWLGPSPTSLSSGLLDGD